MTSIVEDEGRSHASIPHPSGSVDALGGPDPPAGVTTGRSLPAGDRLEYSTHPISANSGSHRITHPLARSVQTPYRGTAAAPRQKICFGPGSASFRRRTRAAFR